VIPLQADMEEELLQNCQILVNNHFELQPIVLTVLAKLSVVTAFDLGLKCFGALSELMGAGRDMETAVTEVIRREVVGKLAGEAERVPLPLLKGLAALARRRPEALAGLQCFPQWLRQHLT